MPAGKAKRKSKSKVAPGKRVQSNSKGRKSSKKSMQSALIEKTLDQALSKMSPALRSQIDQLTKALENQQFDFKDIRFLGIKILQKANDVRKSLTSSSPSKSSKKKRAAQKSKGKKR
jgi:hypothetical protein